MRLYFDLQIYIFLDRHTDDTDLIDLHRFLLKGYRENKVIVMFAILLRPRLHRPFGNRYWRNLSKQ